MDQGFFRTLWSFMQTAHRAPATFTRLHDAMKEHETTWWETRSKCQIPAHSGIHPHDHDPQGEPSR